MNEAMNSQKVPWKVKLGWGIGGWADDYTFMIVNILFLYLYVDYFKLDPVLAGVALCIPRLFDAITDPILGNFSDNFRSRWGRRRPLIIAGAIGCAILLPFYWLPPFLDTVKNPWYCNGPFLFISFWGCFYAAMYTLFVVPYTALGYELTTDYDERTKVLSWRMYFGLLGQMVTPLVYSLSVKKSLFPNIRCGAVTLSIVASIFIVVMGIIPALVCKESPDYSKRERVNLWNALGGILSNRPYLILIVGFFIVLTCCSAPGSIGGLLNLYYVCRGNAELNGTLTLYSGVLCALLSMISIVIISKFSRQWGKREAFIIGMILAAIGNGSYYFTLTPKHPFLQLSSMVLFYLALQGCWLMLDSMCSDVCDYEELRTGRRGEGIISSFRGFIQKASGALCGLLSGLLLKFCGFNAEVAQSAAGLPEAVLERLKLVYVVVPVVGFILGIVLFCFYPLTKARCAEIRQELQQKHSGQ